jgi:hypothetical protein
MSVIVEDTAKALAPVYAEVDGNICRGGWCGQCTRRPGISDSLMRPVEIIELLELAQSVKQVPPKSPPRTLT